MVALGSLIGLVFLGILFLLVLGISSIVDSAEKARLDRDYQKYKRALAEKERLEELKEKERIDKIKSEFRKRIAPWQEYYPIYMNYYKKLNEYRELKEKNERINDEIAKENNNKESDYRKALEQYKIKYEKDFSEYCYRVSIHGGVSADNAREMFLKEFPDYPKPPMPPKMTKMVAFSYAEPVEPPPPKGKFEPYWGAIQDWTIEDGKPWPRGP